MRGFALEFYLLLNFINYNAVVFTGLRVQPGKVYGGSLWAQKWESQNQGIYSKIPKKTQNFMNFWELFRDILSQNTPFDPRWEWFDYFLLIFVATLGQTLLEVLGFEPSTLISPTRYYTYLASGDPLQSFPYLLLD